MKWNQIVGIVFAIVLATSTYAQSTLECPPLNQQGKRAITPEAVKTLMQCIQKTPTIKSLHFNPKTQRYTPARQKIHKTIITSFIKGRPCVSGRNPIAIFTAGPPGSGKTTFLRKNVKWALSPNVFWISADDVREKLPEYKGWNATNTISETNDIVKKMLSMIDKPCSKDVVYDASMSHLKRYQDLIRQLKQARYQIFIVYVTVPIEVSIQRTMRRYQAQGRFVPHNVIKSSAKRSIRVFNQIKNQVAGYILVDGQTGKVIKRGGIPLPSVS